jgi:hypothetical protein
MDRPTNGSTPSSGSLHVTQGVIEAWGDVRRHGDISGVGEAVGHRAGSNFEANRVESGRFASRADTK